MITKSSRGAGWAALLFTGVSGAWAQQPAEPLDPTPLDGGAYALMNQAAGLQSASLRAQDATSLVLEQTRDLGSVGQRLALVRLDGGAWKLLNQEANTCLAASIGLKKARVESCGLDLLQRWAIPLSANGYATLRSAVTGALLLSAPDREIDLEAAQAAPAQAQQWQLRPTFWRGADLAEQEKMEALRARTGLPWWKDSGMVLALDDKGRALEVPITSATEAAQWSINPVAILEKR